MKIKNTPIFIIILLLVLFLIWKRDAFTKPILSGKSPSQDHVERNGYIETDQGLIVKTKSDRLPDRIQNPRQGSTHSPERLSDFFLPADTLINDLTIKEALETLRETYKTTCALTGETPLNISFDLPAGLNTNERISARLSGSLADAVNYLAILARLNVEREGNVYRFTETSDTKLQVEAKSHKINPSFFSDMISSFALDTLEASEVEKRSDLPPLEVFRTLGIPLAPDTQLAFLQGSSELIIRSSNEFDHNTINTLIENYVSNSKKQYKISTKVLALPDNVNIDIPDSSRISAFDADNLMQIASDSSGVDIVTLPSIITKNGKESKVEIVRQAPNQNVEENAKPLAAGITLDLDLDRIGFGQDLSFQFQHTQFAKSAENSPPENILVDTLIDSGQSLYLNDQDTSMRIEIHEDGSRSVIMVTTTAINSNGKPLN